MKLQEIEQWQLFRVVNHLMGMRLPGLYVLGFVIHEGGISEIIVTAAYLRERKTLSKEDLKWYNETWFSIPHSAIQVPYKDRVLLVGFWANDQRGLDALLKELLPNEDTNTDPARDLSRKIYLEYDPTDPNVARLHGDKSEA